MNHLSGKKAVVTGGTRGIGQAIASRLKKEGVQVEITGTRAHSDLSDYIYHSVDFSSLDAVKDFSSLLEEVRPDILVNCAGINMINSFSEIPLNDFAMIQQVNVTAPFQLCQAVLDGMKKKGWGRIVNITSIWGKISKSGRASYSASKFAIDGMTAALAAEVAPFGILANCVAPGFIETDMSKQILGEAGMKEMAAQVPMKRLGKPEEVAALVAWLVSSENSYISGQNIVIDGGFTRV
jgi:NAD(P)-dependent dehydrogenase (short-subunit alcohol dehydrogenase family)